jgi:hypothetical protein
MKEIISREGKSLETASIVGVVNPDFEVPGSVPVLKPALIRHSGHNSVCTSGGKAF